MRARLFCAALWVPAAVWAQATPEMREVLDRLERVEEQNRLLMEEIRALRQQMAGGAAAPVVAGSAAAPVVAGSAAAEAAEAQAGPLPDRMDVAERRIAELDQVKLTSDNRLPVTLTGMLLANTFWNGKASDGAQYPVVASRYGNRSGAGGTFRQSIIGLRMDGPRIFGNGKVTGSVSMDFFSGDAGLGQNFRLRVARLDATWRDTTLAVAFDKPIIAPRNPDSLAQVGLSPLTGAGNLWLWQPQARIEQRLAYGERTGLNVTAGVYQTYEGSGDAETYYSSSLSQARPGYEGRFEWWGQWGSKRIEIAPGFHASSTRVLGRSVPSRLFAVDWLIRPMSRIDFTGTFFNGKNAAVLGGLPQGISFAYGRVTPVETLGGWAQLQIRPTSRAAINFFGGQQDDRNAQLGQGAVLKNQSYGGNFMYRWGSNFLTSFEASQVRSTYSNGTRINPHYDLAFAYLF